MREDRFRGDVADQFVAGKRAAAQPGERGIESAAAGIVGGHHFFRERFGPAVQMDAQFDAGDAILHRGVQFAHLRGVAVPTVSASETVRTPMSFSQISVSSTISGPQGSSYGFPNAMEM